MVDEIRNLRTDIDSIDNNVITNTIDEYTKLNNPLTKDHNTFIVYDEGWDLNDENDKISKKCTGVESVHILFNLMKALEYKDITGIQVTFDYYNCNINSLAIGDGTVWNYCNKETTDLVTNTEDYTPQSELEDSTGKHVAYMLSDDGSKIVAGGNTFTWNFNQDSLKRLLYTTGARVEINLEPLRDDIPVEINNLQFNVYFESSLQNEVDVIYNRLEVMNLPELIKQQSPVQHIYFHSKSLVDEGILDAIQTHCNKKFNTQEYESDDYIPESVKLNDVEYSFSGDELFVTSDIHVVYIMSRSKQNDVYGKYGVPQIYSIYGTGESNIYYQFAYMTKSDADAPATPSHSDEDNLPPGGWTAYPGEISPTVRYCFVTSRVKQNGKWGDWSAPVLFSVYSVDGKDGEKGDTGAKGTDGMSTIVLYKKANELPSTPPTSGDIVVTYKDGTTHTTQWQINQGNIKDIEYAGLQKLQLIKLDMFLLKDQIESIDDKNNLFKEYSGWERTYNLSGNEKYVYMIKLSCNSETIGSWTPPTVVAILNNEEEEYGDIEETLEADDSMVYTGKNGLEIYLYRYGSLVYYYIPSFNYTVSSYNTAMSDTINPDDFPGFSINSFGSAINHQNISNISNGAMIRLSEGKFYLRVNTDAYNTSSNTKKVFFTSNGVYRIEGSIDPDLCVDKEVETSSSMNLLKYLCFTAVFDGTDATRAGKKMYIKIINKRYYRRIKKQSTPKTFTDDNGNDFTTYYYCKVPIRVKPGTYTFKVGYLGDKTYKSTTATRTVTFNKCDLVIEERVVANGIEYRFTVDGEVATVPKITTVIQTDTFTNNQILMPTGGYNENSIFTECTYDSIVYFPTTTTLSLSNVQIECTPISTWVKSITFNKLDYGDSLATSTVGNIQTYEVASNMSITGYKTKTKNIQSYYHW